MKNSTPRECARGAELVKTNSQKKFVNFFTAR